MDIYLHMADDKNSNSCFSRLFDCFKTQQTKIPMSLEHSKSFVMILKLLSSNLSEIKGIIEIIYKTLFFLVDVKIYYILWKEFLWINLVIYTF